MSGVVAGRHIRAPRTQLRRWPAYALTAVVLATMLAVLVAVADRGPTADGPSTMPPSGVEVDRVAPADARPARARDGALVPEVRRHITGLRPRGVDHADTLRARADAAVDRAPQQRRGGRTSPR